MKLRLSALIALVFAIALGLAFYTTFLRAVPWDQAGGMIGWTQAAMESRLGPPDQVIERDVVDAHSQKIRPRTPGTYRTLLFDSMHGRFIAWMKQEKDRYVCVSSSWVDKGLYY